MPLPFLFSPPEPPCSPLHHMPKRPYLVVPRPTRPQGCGRTVGFSIGTKFRHSIVLPCSLNSQGRLLTLCLVSLLATLCSTLSVCVCVCALFVRGSWRPRSVPWRADVVRECVSLGRRLIAARGDGDRCAEVVWPALPVSPPSVVSA